MIRTKRPPRAEHTGRSPRTERAALIIALISAALGIACALAGVIGGKPVPGLIVGAVFALLAVAIRWPLGGGETAAVVAGGDVRQRQIDLAAMAVSDTVLTFGLTGWLIVELVAGDHPWPPAALLLLSTGCYLIAIEVLRRHG